MMDRNSKTKKKRTSRAGETKVLIGALAFTSALGLWNLFAHQAISDVASGMSQDNTTGDLATPEGSPNTIVLNLPPMPTLVPDQPTLAMDIPPVPTAPAVVNVSNPVTQPQTKILLGGAQPGAAQPGGSTTSSKKHKSPAPVTSTRSSR